MKTKSIYVCQSCGQTYPKWRGKCEGCMQWDTLVVENISETPFVPVNSEHTFDNLAQGEEMLFPRLMTGITEFDRVCGGGIVAGSVSLVAGDPGIGKSTLLLQLASVIGQQTAAIYISGEESAEQIRLRAKRLGLQQASVYLKSTNHLDVVLSLLPNVMRDGPWRGFMIIDSIQTMMLKEVGSTAGTLGQIRECIGHLITLAKSTGLTIMVVGHITKEGLIAGPKVLEHMVDTVLYFEGDGNRPHRLLRTMKNRFGAIHEVGVFEMTSKGLQEVSNPSALFISTNQKEIPGSCIFPSMEGSRPLLVEFQALSTSSFLPSPRRAVVGWDHNRLMMILAVLEARCGWAFSKKDVFLTVLGGMKIIEPAADLCVALALLSCMKKRPLPDRAIAFGEIGLTGEIYPTSFSEQRLREAKLLGFKNVFSPTQDIEYTDFTHISMNHVKDLALYFQS